MKPSDWYVGPGTDTEPTDLTPTTATILKTPEEVKREFERAGTSIREWAKANGFDFQAVYGVLNGRFKGGRGNSHRIAVALGLKDGRIVKTENLFPVQEAA